MSTVRRTAVATAVVAVAVLVLLGAPAHRAAAQGEIADWSITDFKAEMQVDDQGVLHVTEKIDVDFSGAPHHGIFRNIQTRFRYDEVKADYDRVTPLTVEDVSGSSGTPDQYETSTDGDQTVLKIGDPDQTISGRHSYTIRYRVKGVLNGFPDHDELYWNIVGLGWAVPVEHAEATLGLPGPVTDATCFQGPEQSNLPCDSAQVAGDTVTYSQDGLAPHNGLTAVAGFPTGIVPAPQPVLDQRWTVQRAFALRPDTVLPAGGLLVVVVGGFGLLAWRTGRDERFVGSATDVAFGSQGGATERVRFGGRDPIPVEFVPPDKLRPGQVGTLIDEQANPLDVTATIIDLAVRGHLKIVEIPKEGIFGKPDWTLTRLENGDALQEYERTLLDGLFATGPDVQLSELKDHFHTTLVKVEDLLYEDTVANAWFRTRPDETRNRWRVMGIIVLVVGAAVTAALAVGTTYGLLGLPLVIGGLLLAIGASRFPRRTAKGYGTLRRVLGFKRFIDESEKERAQFAERQNLFSEYLPYAVVFGATEKWARAFSGIDGQLPDTSGWYVGPTVFTIATFSSTMDNFSVTTSGTIASTPSSSGSSGFGGGGFSGGGFGGGGGGAW